MIELDWIGLGHLPIEAIETHKIDGEEVTTSFVLLYICMSPWDGL